MARRNFRWCKCQTEWNQVLTLKWQCRNLRPPRTAVILVNRISTWISSLRLRLCLKICSNHNIPKRRIWRISSLEIIFRRLLFTNSIVWKRQLLILRKVQAKIRTCWKIKNLWLLRWKIVKRYLKRKRVNKIN